MATGINSTRGSTSYTHTVSPRALQASRPKYREPSQPTLTLTDSSLPQNIMYDKRVVRGSTVAHVPKQQTPNEKEKATPKRSRQQKSTSPLPPSTPDPVNGRKHMDIQTDEYLEELTDRPIEVDVDTQTDPLLDRPPSPKFIPVKSGIDTETQIYPGELFDFDYEVEPILEVLVGKILEQSMMEIMEEDELSNLQLHQFEFEQRRNAELAEVQRMEESERRKLEEKERRLEQERNRVLAEKRTKEKVSARQFAQRFLSNLTADVFTNLSNRGYFYDATAREVETQFLPWIFTQVDAELQRAEVSHRIINHLVQSALSKSEDRHRQRKLQEEEEEKRAKAEVKFNLEVVYHSDDSKRSPAKDEDDEDREGDEDDEEDDDEGDDDDGEDDDDDDDGDAKSGRGKALPHR